jgi:hypothetical protein
VGVKTFKLPVYDEDFKRPSKSRDTVPLSNFYRHFYVILYTILVQLLTNVTQTAFFIVVYRIGKECITGFFFFNANSILCR